MLAVFTIFLISEVFIKNFENGAYFITIFNILSVTVNFNLAEKKNFFFFLLDHLYLGREIRF